MRASSMVCLLTRNTTSFSGHTKAITYATLRKTTNPDNGDCGDLLATASDDGLVIIWDNTTGTKKCEISGEGEVCSALSWSADGDILYTAYDEVIRAYSTVSMLQAPADIQPLRTFTANQDEIGQIATDQKGHHIAAADDSGEIRILDAITTKQLSLLTRTHTNICSSVSFVGDRPGECVSGGLDGKIILWDCNRCVPKDVVDFMAVTQEGTSAAPMFNPPMVNCVKVTADGRRVAAGLADGTVRVFDIATVRSQGAGRGGKGKKQKQKQRKPPRRELQQIRCLRGAHRHSVSAFAIVEGCVVRRRGGAENTTQRGKGEVESGVGVTDSGTGLVGGVEQSDDAGDDERVVDGDSLCIVSAGADKKICVWDVRDNLSEGQTEEPYDGLVSDGLLLTVKHPHTINWIDAMVTHSGGGVTVVVADQTPTVTVYQLTF